MQLPLAGTKTEKDISDYFALGNSSENFSILIKNIVSKVNDTNMKQTNGFLQYSSEYICCSAISESDKENGFVKLPKRRYSL